MTKAIFIGSGIGGLAAGIALHRAGLDVEIFERAPELREVGSEPTHSRPLSTSVTLGVHMKWESVRKTTRT